MDVLGANRLQRVVSSKQSCGFSTQACNGTCCRSYPRRPRLATGQIIRTSAGYIFKVARDTDRPGQFASCETLTERSAQPIAGIR